MEKSMSTFKRLLAMLLVCAMVIGYVPAYSFATDAVGGEEEAPITTKVTPFVVTVSRTEYKEAESGDESAETPEETPGETPSEEPGEEPAEPEVAYTYTAILKVDGQQVDADKVAFAWAYGQNGEFKVEGAKAENVSQEYKELVLKCTYDGITLTETVKESDFAEQTDIDIKLAAAMEQGQVKLGAHVSAPEEASTQNFAGQWVVTEWNREYVDEAGFVVNSADGVVRLATLQLRGQAAEGQEPVVYLQMDWNVTIVPVKYTATIAVEEGEREWYNTVNAVVTVTGDVPVKDSSFVDAPVLVDGAAFAADWTTNDNGISWQSSKISLNETGEHTISACDTALTFQIDTVEPTVEIEEAYYTTVNGQKITVINFTYTVGKSGVDKISVYDGDKLVVENLGPNATGSIVFDWIENPKVVVVGKNGLASEVIPVPQAPLTIAVNGPAEDAVIGTVDNVTYAPDGELTVVIDGAAGEGDYKLDTTNSAITVKDQAGNEIKAGAWTYADGKWTAVLSLANGLSELSVHAVDAKGRETTASFDQKYAVDREAPVITASRDSAPVNKVGSAGSADYVEYYNEAVTYSFTISDILLGDVKSYVTYQLEGAEPVNVTFVDGKAEVKVENGQKLTRLTVYGRDASGNLTSQVIIAEGNGLGDTWIADMGLTYECNVVVDTEAPVVSLAISDNVQAFYRDNGGRVYAVLKDDNGTVALTVTVKDENLSEACLAATGAEWNITYDENEKLYVACAVFEVAVNEHTTGILEYDFSFRDLANQTSDTDLSLNVNPTNVKGLAPGTTLQAQAAGHYQGKLHIDRRAPSSADQTVPEITVKPSITPAETASGLELFNGAFEFTMEVYDRTDGSTDSGIQYIGWEIADEKSVVKGGKYENNIELNDNLDGTYTIPVEMLANEGESNEVTLTIRVMDHALNQITYTKVFGVDIKDPEITHSFGKNDPEPTNVNHYNGHRTLDITVSDLNLKDAKVIVNGEVVMSQNANGSDTITFAAYEFTQDGVYKIEVEATDLVGHTATLPIGEFTIDQAKPEVTVTKTVEQGKGLIHTDNGVDYYNGDVTYTVTISDEWLTNAFGGTQVAEFTYTLEDGTVKSVTLPASEGGWVKAADKDTYSYTFTVTDGQVLTGMTVKAVDNANNSMDGVSGETAFANEDGVWNYTGNDVVVDKTAPVITVEKVGTPVHTYDGHDYHNDVVTYTITVKDSFLNENVAQSYVKCSIMNDQDETNVTNHAMALKVGDGSKVSEDEFIYTFTVNDGQVLKGIEFLVKDNSGNVAVFSDAEVAKVAQFAQIESGAWAYNGNPVVVDMTAPSAMISFDKDVDAFYMNGDTIYAVLKTPVEGNSGESVEGGKSVTVTIEVTDRNLAIDENDIYGVKANKFAWEGTPTVNNVNNKITYTAKSEEVKPDGTAVFAIDAQVVDLAGHYLTKENVTVAEADNETNLGVTVPVIPGLGENDEGRIAFNVYVDRRRPTSGDSSEVPAITIEPSIEPTKTATEPKLDLFNGAFNFALHVTDGGDVKDAGIKYVKWNLKDGKSFVKENAAYRSNTDSEATDKLDENGNYTIPVELAKEFDESNEVTLAIEAMDNVGNKVMFVKTFGVDTLKPRIEYTYTYGENEAMPTNGKYYNKDVTLTVTIEDLNLNEEFNPEKFIAITKYSTVPEQGTDNELPVESKWYPEGLSYNRVGDTLAYTFSMTFEEDGVYGVTTFAEDLAKNRFGKQAPDNVFVLDKTAPEINVVKTVEEGKGLINTKDGVDYYNGEVTYNVTISDQNLSAVPGGVNAAVLTYTFEDNTTYTVKLGAQNDPQQGDSQQNDPQWTVFQYLDGKTYYQYEFTVKNDQVLESIQIQAMDNASNPATIINCNDEENTSFTYMDEETNTHVYGGKVVVDTIAPVITVEKVGESVHTYNKKRDYHDAEVTYTFTVKDNFLNKDVAQSYVKYFITNDLGVTAETNEPMALTVGKGLMVSEDTFTYSFTVTDGQVLEDMEFLVKDNSGNIATFATAKDAADAQFEQVESGAWDYIAYPIVVDMTAPAAKLEFSDNVVSFYTNGDTVYAVLADPVVGNSGAVSTRPAEKVTMTLTVTDKNLAIDNKDVNGVKDRTDDGFNWSGATPVNQESTITYYAESANVNPDGTHAFKIDVQILDLAGHKLLSSESDSEQKLVLVPASGDPQLGGIIPIVDVDTNGDLKFVVSTDRRRPTSSSDVDAPTITIEPSITPTKTASGLDLFNGAFSFALNVTDGENTNKNSGLNYVKWTVQDKNGVVAGYENVKNYDERVLTGDYTINVPLAVANGESNDVILTIEAMDNVGNKILFEKVFGVDNLAPRVTITQSNHSVQNDFYFKNDQVITVTIEDLNFEPTTSSVTTEVGFNGWQNVGGNTYRTILTYNRDGDYTFAMQTTDRANNAAVIDYTTGLTALQKFTIDKTAPVINVSFNPAIAVDTDVAGVQYFDQNRSVNVSITEHNFRASDVVSNLGAKNALGAWRSNGDTHTAGDVFYEGNNYSVSVQYTDLAGNPAQSYSSPTFSVDLGLPAIEIRGNMTNGQLNIVPDDLVLGFTITDTQNNLKDFGVEVLFLDRNFNQTKVEGAEFYTVSGQGNRTTGYIDFTNIESVKANDGIYTVRVNAVDYAGHVVTLMPDLIFSLNRFGSTFFTDDSYTKSFLTAGESGVVYRKDVEHDLVIKENNPNRVWQNADKTQEGSLITVSVNGNVKTLVADTDYEVDVMEKGSGSNKWYEYTYRISKNVFRSDGKLVDGEYTIFFYSEDDAANKNTNESNEGSSLTLGHDGSYSGMIIFTLDHKEPVVTILGISDGANIWEKNQSVEINISDNTSVFIEVYINDKLVEQVEVITGQPVSSDWIYYDEVTGTYKMNMSEKYEPQNVRVRVKDAAGNEITEEVSDIMLTEKVWYQYINSTFAKLATVVVLLALFMLIMVLVKKRKQKKEAEAAAAAKS